MTNTAVPQWHDTTHNGWANYATWRVNLEMCDDITSSLVGEQTFESVEELAEYLKEEVDRFISQEDYGTETNMYVAGWARAFVEDVDWWEIAQSNAEELVRAGEDTDDE